MKDGKLESKDLMIGDWVKLKGYKFTYKVECVFHEAIRIECGDHSLEDHEISKFEPIQLTLDILKKNGWNGDYSSAYPLFDSFRDADDGYLEISVFEDGEIRATINICEYDLFQIEYVHELQHALRLHGLNELADNFKV